MALVVLSDRSVAVIGPDADMCRML